MKKLVRIVCLLLAIASVVSLFACTSGDVVQTGNVDPDKLNVAGRVKISYACNNETEKNAVSAYVTAFMKKYPKAIVDRDYSNTASTEARIASGDIGDVFYTADSGVYSLAKDQKVLMKLEVYLEALGVDRADVYSGIYDAGVIDNHLYYVARDFNQVFMIYNKDAISSKGLSSRVQEEWSWEDFLSICKQLTDDDYYGGTIDLTFWPAIIPFLNAYAGRNKWYSTKNKTVDLTSGDTLKALSEAIEACQKGYLNLNLGNNEKFDGKEGVFTYTVYPRVYNEAKQYDNLEVDWDLINMPLFDNPSFGAGSTGLVVFNKTKNPDTAAALALFYFSSEGQEAFNSQPGGSVPLLASMKDSDFWRHPNDEWADKNWNAAIYMAEDYAVVGQINCILPSTIASAMSAGMAPALKSVLSGETSLEDAMIELETQVNELWSTLS